MRKPTWALLLTVLAAAGGGLYLFWRHELVYPSTSDAYISAHVVQIQARVGGQLVELPVRDHQRVAQGQLLMVIDERPYRIALQQAQAQLTLAQQQKLAAEAALSAAAALVDQRQAQLDTAQRSNRRDVRLLARQAVSQAQAEADRDRLHEAQAGVAAGQAARRQALREQGEAGARIGVAAAALAQARLNLSFTHLSAPAAGVLGEVSVRPGDIVQPGQALFPLVEDQAFWVEANYKETDIARIHAGQSATIHVDMYPDTGLRGVVESISPASGVAFSLLPPENATGNWVKVTQRFPVRVRVLREDNDPPLRVGTSCSVTIDTRGRAAPAAPIGERRPAADGPGAVQKAP